MKSIFLLLAILALTETFAQVQPVVSKKLSPARGHYKKIAAYDAAPVKGMEAVDAKRFELAPPNGHQKSNASTTASGPATQPADSKCDPEACKPGEVIGNGRVRKPFYLNGSEKFIIPDPPANSSKQTRAELDYLLQLQSRRSDEDVRASLYYAGVYYKTSAQPTDPDYPKWSRNLFHIGRSLGTWFNADSLPLTAALAANVWKDAEYYIWKFKNCYSRIRPYKLDSNLKNSEETNWAAYPSGHSTNSYVNAYLYSELIPEFTDFFFKDAFDMAHSREIIGVHFPSDSESGRILAQQIVARLFTNPAFKTDFEAAKKEIGQAKKEKGF